MSPAITRESLIPEDNRGVALTLQRMLGWVLARPGPFALRAMRRMGFSGLFRPGTPEGAARLHTWVQAHVLFVPDPGAEQITTPEALLAQVEAGGAAGDCDEYATLLAHLAYWLGFPVTVVVLSQRPDRQWDHVYVRVGTTAGWVALDPTLGPEPGREIPADETTARWDIPVRA